MPRKTSPTGSELFIVDNSDEDWKAARYLRDWCHLSKSIDVADYRKVVVVARAEAIRPMAEIDRLIDTRGGWPGTFQIAVKT